MNAKLDWKTMTRLAGLLAAASTIEPVMASACAVCFGDPNDPQSHALNQAILTLLGVLGAVCCGIGVFILRIIARTRAVEGAAPAQQPSAHTGEA